MVSTKKVTRPHQASRTAFESIESNDAQNLSEERFSLAVISRVY